MTLGRFGRFLALTLVAGMLVLAAGCSLIEGEDDNGNGNDGGSASGNGDAPAGVTVQRVVFTTDLGDLPARGIVPSTAREIRAVVTISGVEPGMTITGSWYQLGVADPGPAGREIATRDVELTANEISPEGATSVNFALQAGASGFPNDTWLMRVFVDGALVRTSGFVVAEVVSGGNQGGQPQEEPTPTP